MSRIISEFNRTGQCQHSTPIWPGYFKLGHYPHHLRGSHSETRADGPGAAGTGEPSAVDDLHNIENPARGVKKFREQARQRYLSREEMPRFLKAAAELESRTMGDFFLMLLWTGQRAGKVQSMAWADIDIKGRIHPARPSTTTSSIECSLSFAAMASMRSHSCRIDAMWSVSSVVDTGVLRGRRDGDSRTVESSGFMARRSKNARAHEKRTKPMMRVVVSLPCTSLREASAAC